jgi:hypothetical protein
MEDDILALAARFELAFAESKSAVLTAGPSELDLALLEPPGRNRTPDLSFTGTLLYH